MILLLDKMSHGTLVFDTYMRDSINAYLSLDGYIDMHKLLDIQTRESVMQNASHCMFFYNTQLTV